MSSAATAESFSTSQPSDGWLVGVSLLTDFVRSAFALSVSHLATFRATNSSLPSAHIMLRYSEQTSPLPKNRTIRPREAERSIYHGAKPTSVSRPSNTARTNNSRD